MSFHFLLEEDRVLRNMNRHFCGENLDEENPKKVENLAYALKMLARQKPDVISNYWTTVVPYAADPRPEVRKMVLEFFSELIKKEPEFIPCVIPFVDSLLDDDDSTVMENAFRVGHQMMQATFDWITGSLPRFSSNMSYALRNVSGVKVKLESYIASRRVRNPYFVAEQKKGPVELVDLTSADDKQEEFHNNLQFCNGGYVLNQR